MKKTYQAPAGLGVTAAGVAVAVTPLAGAQVEAGTGPRVALVTLLQRHPGKYEIKSKRLRCETSNDREEYVFVPLALQRDRH